MKLRRKACAAAVAIAAGLAAGCGPAEEPAAGPPQPAREAPPAAAPKAPAAKPAVDPAEVARTEARQIFKIRCAVCHGETGRGDGPGAAGLEPPPRNFHLAEWQDSVSDAHIAKIIQLGGAAVGLSPLMPPNPDLVDRPEVVSALVERIRGLRDG